MYSISNHFNNKYKYINGELILDFYTLPDIDLLLNLVWSCNKVGIYKYVPDYNTSVVVNQIYIYKTYNIIILFSIYNW
jgi:hypothetical protein